MENQDFCNLLGFDVSSPRIEIEPWETDLEQVWESELPVWKADQPQHQDICGERGGAILESDQQKSLTGRSISQISDVDTNMNPVSYMLECDEDEREEGGPNFSLPCIEIDGGKVHLRETVHPEPHQEVCAEIGVAALEYDQWISMTSDFSYNSPVTMNGASSTTEREGGPSSCSASDEINQEKVPLCETLGPVYAEGGTEGTTEKVTFRIHTSDGRVYPIYWPDAVPEPDPLREPPSIFNVYQRWVRWKEEQFKQMIDRISLENVPCQENKIFVEDLIGTVMKDVEDRAATSRHGTGAKSALRSLEEIKGKVSSQNKGSSPLPSLRDVERSFRAIFGRLKTGVEDLFVGAQGQQHQLSLHAMLELINVGVSMVDKLGNTREWISKKLGEVMKDLKFRELFVGKVLQDCVSSLSAMVPSILEQHRKKFISIDLLMGSFLDLGSGRLHHVGSGHRNES